MKRVLCLLALLCMPVLALAEEVGLSVGGHVVGFAENVITISAPFDGEAVLRVSDDLNVYRTITMPVQAGRNDLTWDGLGEHEQRLPTGKNSLSVTVTDSDGHSASAEISIQVDKSKQAVIFALSNADDLYLDSADEWLAEVKMVRAGKLTVEYYRADDMTAPLYTRRKNIETLKVFEYAWDGKIDGAKVEPGNYVLRFYADETPDYARDVHVTVKAEKPQLVVALTETYLPERGMSDAEIWALMMQPSVVIDAKNTKDVNVRSEPGKNKGKVLGTVHGQSQGLKVLEIGSDGYAKVGAYNHEDGSYMEGYVEASTLKAVMPRQDYGLLLDKVKQRMAIFYRGERIAEIQVSTGLVEKGKLIQETAAGAFLLQEHMMDFSNKGYTYSCVIRYDGGNLLHQAGYQEKNGRADYSKQAPMVGMKASHGCVRLPVETDHGVNAYWLWTHLPSGTRLFILDDEEQRAWEAKAVAGQITDAKPSSPKPLQEGETELVLTLGGDAVLGTRESWWQKEESLPSYLAEKGMAYPFSGLMDIFAADDMTFVNLECVLKGDNAGEDKSKEYRFRGLPEYAQVLRESAIEQVNIANNHYIDYGIAGRDATRKALEEAGMPYSGFGYTYVWEQDGHRIGFAGCRETTYKNDHDIIRRDVAELRRAGCDVIIYSCHWGTEYRANHNDMQESMAREAMLAGVDVIVGTHPHVVQGIGIAGNTVVLWSLGNLMFGGTHEMKTFDATLAQVRLRFDGDRYVGCTVSYIPILTSSAAPDNDFHPVIAEGKDRERILEKIQADTPFKLMDEMYFPAK